MPPQGRNRAFFIGGKCWLRLGGKKKILRVRTHAVTRIQIPKHFRPPIPSAHHGSYHASRAFNCGLVRVMSATKALTVGRVEGISTVPQFLDVIGEHPAL